MDTIDLLRHVLGLPAFPNGTRNDWQNACQRTADFRQVPMRCHRLD